MDSPKRRDVERVLATALLALDFQGNNGIFEKPLREGVIGWSVGGR